MYGIKSCETCRRARRYLDAHDIDFEFIDVRDDGLSLRMLERWAARIDWNKLLNKQSLTWRKIPEVDRNDITRERAFALMIENPTLVKRPVLEANAFLAVGFKEQRFAELWELVSQSDP